MKKPSLAAKGKSRYKQGIFVPENPGKYIGEDQIIYRSYLKIIQQQNIKETI